MDSLKFRNVCFKIAAIGVVFTLGIVAGRYIEYRRWFGKFDALAEQMETLDEQTAKQDALLQAIKVRLLEKSISESSVSDYYRGDAGAIVRNAKLQTVQACGSQCGTTEFPSSVSREVLKRLSIETNGFVVDPDDTEPTPAVPAPTRIYREHEFQFRGGPMFSGPPRVEIWRDADTGQKYFIHDARVSVTPASIAKPAEATDADDKSAEHHWWRGYNDGFYVMNKAKAVGGGNVTLNSFPPKSITARAARGEIELQEHWPPSSATPESK
jgi:hypothetical protein